MHNVPMFCAVAALTVLTACQTSTYENRSTKDENVVTATGKAAEVAAGANTSHNCPSCADGDTPTSGGKDTETPTSKAEQSIDRITDSAIDTATNEASRAVNEVIRDIFD